MNDCGDRPLPAPKAQAVERAKNEWQAVADALPLLVVALDADGRVLRVNRTIERWGLAKVAGVRGLSLDALIHGDCVDPDCYLGSFAAQAADALHRGGSLRGEFADRRLGRTFEMSLVANPSGARANADAQAAAGTLIVEDVTERRRTEAALRHSESELRLMSAQLMSAQEAERQRIAKELHDGIGQALGVIKLGIEQARGGLQLQDEAALRDSLGGLVRKVQEAMAEVRRIAMDLRPSSLDDLGLIATLSWFFRELQAVHPDLRLLKDVRVGEADIPPALKTTIFRIVQEAVSNVFKHAASAELRFSIGLDAGGLRVAVEDRGRGFQAGLPPASPGLGLASMRERAELSGGTLTIRSAPGAGTRVEASWPLPPRKAS